MALSPMTEVTTLDTETGTFIYGPDLARELKLLNIAIPEK